MLEAGEMPQLGVIWKFCERRYASGIERSDISVLSRLSFYLTKLDRETDGSRAKKRSGSERRR